MSTRAVYRFIDAENTHSQVYIHSDGYHPTYAWNYFDAVFQRKLAWKLPRFEADEFAAAFIAANKTREGSVRCMLSGNKNLPGDIEYLYELQSDGSANLQLTVYRVNNWKKLKKKKLWSGTVQQFIVEQGEHCEEQDAA